jgi:hypothetical protein
VKVPEELAGQLWFESADKPSQCNTFRAHVFAQKIAEWAADQELEACCEWLRSQHHSDTWANRLRAARRPKPPTLAEQALEQYEGVEDILRHHGCIPAGCIRAALNRLKELEANQ